MIGISVLCGIIGLFLLCLLFWLCCRRGNDDGDNVETGEGGGRRHSMFKISIIGQRTAAKDNGANGGAGGTSERKFSLISEERKGSIVSDIREEDESVRSIY